jgi:DNA-binding NarL/FixJ family response regulator
MVGMGQNQIRKHFIDTSPETFYQVVEAVYGCALDASRWQETVGMIAELCQSKCCVLGISDLKTGANELTFQVGCDEHYLRLHEEKYGALNPCLGPLQLVPVGTVVTSAMMIDDYELLRTRYYQEWLKPQGLLDTVGFIVLKAGQRIASLTATRLECEGRYGDAEVRLLNRLTPHVCRSVAVADVFNLKTVKSKVLEATLDALKCGVYLTDHEGHILYMNRAAQCQVETGDALLIQNSRLTPVDKAAHATLAKALAEAAAGSAEEPAGAVALPGAKAKGLVGTILSLSLNRDQRRNPGLNSGATVAVFVQDPVAETHLPGQAFAKLYGLTGSELRVLLAMSPAHCIKEAAEMLEISEATAKTHLQHIYAKTGTSKQTELMSLFISSVLPVELNPKPCSAKLEITDIPPK